LELPQHGELPPYSEQEILEELDRLLASREFSQGERMSRFLRFVVLRTLAGDRDSLKESVIGNEVFDRGAGYDPKSEPIVRTEARRLRGKLDHYYQESGRESRILISVPTGGYVAAFLPGKPEPSAPRLAVMPKPEIEQAAVAVVPRTPALSAPGRVRRNLKVLLAAAAIVALAVAAVILWRPGSMGLRHPEFTLSTITSYPGAQSHPAVTADGRQVAFSWAATAGGSASLYVAPTDGGSAKRVTTGPDPDDLPSWSPDGTELAFVRAAKTLMIVSPLSGGERKLGASSTSFLAWAPNGKILLHCDWVRGHNLLAIFATDPATGSSRQITFPPETSTGDTSAELSPDGNVLAFTRCVLGNCDIYTVPLQGGRCTRITHDECSFNGLTWMPDGRSIVYSSRRRGPYILWRVDATGSGEPERMPVADDALFPKASRGPNGAVRIVFEQHVGVTNIWRQPIGSNGAGEKLPLRDRLIASTRLDTSPQFSPDGRRIVFASDRTGYDEIWVSDADGGNQAALTNLRAQNTGSPRWSPDGNRIAFDVLSKNGRAVFLVDSRGGAAQQWTPWGDAARPSWSRDGRWIFFGGSDSKGESHVWKVSTSTDRAMQQVTNEGGFEAYESPDGGTLYYTAGSELRAMPSTGGKWTRVTERSIHHGWWSVTAAGIYFVEFAPRGSRTANTTLPVFLVVPGSGAAHQVASIDGPVFPSTPDFAVSADGRTLLYSRVETSTSQVRMIEER
jgi:Tol biopolymer transport system component